MDELSLLQQLLGLNEDDAFAVLSLCDMLDRADAVAAHGYPKDTPRGRDLAARLQDANYRDRLVALAEDEALGASVVDALKNP